ncbi:MAG: hypothetical protein HQM14_17510 [SAR324 cluster bacterium]|nr:hypothetical protein [SAR324 cluster bacterium]
MGLVDATVKNILSMVRVETNEAEEGDVEFAQKIFISEDEMEKIGAMRPHPEEIAYATSDILGQYFPMKSPGMLILHWDKIGSHFWHILSNLTQQYFIEEQELKRMVNVIVTKTYVHEQFHHFCDVARHLFGNRYEKDQEEALAVAWSYKYLQEKRGVWNSPAGRIPGPLYRELVRQIFQYRAPGYKDWVNYQTENEFNMGLIAYLGPSSSRFLQQSGLDVAVILRAIQNCGLYCYIEKLQP